MNTQMRYTRALSLLAPAALLLALAPARPAAAQSGLGFTLDTPTVTTDISSSDQVFTFNGTLTNNTATALYLNGDLFSVDPPLTLDDSGFFNTFLFPTDSSGNPVDPQPLAVGQSLNLALFSATVPGGTSLGSYNGLFQIQGGATTGAYALLASQTFKVNTVPAGTAPAPPAVPEVSSGVTFSIGIILLGGLAVAARRRKAPATVRAAS